MLFLAYFHHLTCRAWHHPPCCIFFVSAMCLQCEVFLTFEQISMFKLCVFWQLFASYERNDMEQ